MISHALAIDEQSNSSASIDSMLANGDKYARTVPCLILAAFMLSALPFNVIHDTSFINSFISKQRSLVEEPTQSHNSSDLLQEMLSNMSYINYEGSWYSNQTEIGSMKSGSFFFQIALDYKKPHQIVTYVLRAIEGKYVDNWDLIYSTSPIDNLTLFLQPNLQASAGNCIEISGTFKSNAEVGQMFKQTGYVKGCSSNITILLNQEDSFNKIRGSLMSSCEIQLEFEVSKENLYTEYRIINVYTVIVSSFCLISIVSSLWLVNLIEQDEYLSTSFSLITICQSGFWSILGTIAHFFLTLNYTQYLLQFGSLTLLFIACFAVADRKLLFLVWKLKFNQAELKDVVKSWMSYVSFILFVMVFFSMVFTMRLYFDRKYIVFTVVMTWLPQIVYNITYSSRVFIPSYYIIFTSMFRLVIPCYFRGYSYNFFLVAPDGNVVLLSLVIMLILTTVMYSQRFFGSRWFLPSRFRGELDHYKSAADIQSLDDKEECLICLQIMALNKSGLPISPIANDFSLPSDLISIEQIRNEKRRRLLEVLWKMLYFKQLFNYDLKPFFLTDCSHLFHSKCIDHWLRIKKDCPKCRRTINDNYYI